jgi:hypothetical protein
MEKISRREFAAAGAGLAGFTFLSARVDHYFG